MRCSTLLLTLPFLSPCFGACGGTTADVATTRGAGDSAAGATAATAGVGGRGPTPAEAQAGGGAAAMAECDREDCLCAEANQCPNEAGGSAEVDCLPRECGGADVCRYHRQSADSGGFQLVCNCQGQTEIVHSNDLFPLNAYVISYSINHLDDCPCSEPDELCEISQCESLACDVGAERPPRLTQLVVGEDLPYAEDSVLVVLDDSNRVAATAPIAQRSIELDLGEASYSYRFFVDEDGDELCSPGETRLRYSRVLEPDAARWILTLHTDVEPLPCDE